MDFSNGDDGRFGCGPPRSMDDLPNVDHTFAFRADLAEMLVPAASDPIWIDWEKMETRVTAYVEQRRHWRAGVLLRWGSLWVGAHWSPKNRRLCINFIPFVTFWVTPPGGVAP